MNLEDHLGDILRKARQAANISTAAAAEAAGASEIEYRSIEETGRLARRPNFQGLASLLGLHARKLEGIADGWLPSAIDVGIWRQLRQITTRGASYSVNCYLVWDETAREAAVFDTGFDARPIFDLIAQNQLQLKHLFITHTHHDHVEALGPIRSKFPNVQLHSNSKNAPADQRNRPDDIIHVGRLQITNRETPGHAEDGNTYLIGNFPNGAPNAAVVGDALFAGSMGGAREFAELAKQKIREQIFTLPLETLICPGHGPLTTVAQEKSYNPFFVE